jgi:AcrR family transcriptional regulator
MTAECKAIATRKPQLVRADLLDAAQAEFREAGFAGASISRIVERSGRSKPTLFRHFATKRALFEGVVERVAATWSDQVDWQTITADSPQPWLTEFAARTLAWITSDDNLFVGRMAIAEGYAFPEVGARYRALAIEPMHRVLAERLCAWIAEGRLRCADPVASSELFFDLVIAGRVARLLYNPADRPDAADDGAHVARAVGLFLHGIAGAAPAANRAL